MFSRLAALPRWKRRLFALVTGLLLGVGVTLAYQGIQYQGMRRLADDYVAARKTGDVEKMAALFCWDGVPAEERGRIKLILKQELDLTLRNVRIEPADASEAQPREALDGRRVPNLKPACRLVLSYGDEQGAGISGWLAGKTSDGYRIIVYRPETPAAN